MMINDAAFIKAVEVIKSANAIRFCSTITNEDAHILQLLKEKFGIKLFNEDARLYTVFMQAYSSVSGKLACSASIKTVEEADAIIVIGTRIASDNPMVYDAIKTASKDNNAKIVYSHPMEDVRMKNVATQFIKYEVGTEEGVLALIANTLLQNCEVDEHTREFLEELDLGYLEAESNVGDDELQLMMQSFQGAKNHVLILGSDLFAHKRAKNIAKLAAIIEEYTPFSLLIVPTQTNTIGVSLTCKLDVDEDIENVVTYNAKGDFIMSSSEEASLAMAALKGHTLSDIADALGVNKENRIDYANELDVSKGFKPVALEDVDDLPEYNGTIVYQCNPILQFNEFTDKIHQLEKDTFLRGSAQFAAAARIVDGDVVNISYSSKIIQRVFKQDDKLKGTIALNPTFDLKEDFSRYRFEKSKIERVA